MSRNLSFGLSRGRNNLAIIVLAVVIVALLIAGLILPPIALPSRLGLGSGGCKTLSTKNPSLDHPDGLTVALDPESKSTLALKLSSVPEAQQENMSGELKTALKSLPKGYKAKGTLFQIAACGARAVPSTLSVAIPEGAEPWETLDLLTWDGKAWQWIGGHLDGESGVIAAHVTEVPQNVIMAQNTTTLTAVASDLPSSGQIAPEGAGLATMLFVPGLLPADDGGINGDPDALPRPPEGLAAALYPSIRNWAKPGRANPSLVSDMIADAKLRATHVKALTNLVAKSRYAGVQIDYRGLGEEDRAAFSDFIAQLGDSLHKVNKRLVVVVPAPIPQPDGKWDTTGYDWAHIGRVSDFVQVDLPLDPAALGKNSEALVRWAIGEVSRNKLYLGLTSLSVDQAGTDVALVSLDQALKPFGSVKGPEGTVAPGTSVSVTLSSSTQNVTFDSFTKAYRVNYVTNDGKSRTVILGGGGTLAIKLDWALRYHLRGVTIRGLLENGNDPGVFAAVQQYSDQTSPDSTPIQVVWTVQGTPAATAPLTRAELVWTAPSAPGAFTIAAAIGGLARGQATLTVGGVAATPALTATGTTTATATTTTTVSVAGACTPSSKFVADVTVPDNSKFDKGAAFTKTWRVKNSSTCDWPADTALAFLSGRKLGAAQTTVAVGVVKSGEAKDISVNMQAPNEDASGLSGTWQLQSSGKPLSGDANLTVVIVAGSPATPTPTPQQPQQPSAGPVAPPSSGPTMYGIHAHWGALYNDEASLAQTASRIADLGLGWTKVQVRWGDEDYFYGCDGNFGFDWNHTNQVINAAGAKGQRVLFSVVTSPPCTHSWNGGDVHAPPDNPDEFANFLGQLASRYAGRGIAIEVWNEMNIDREWKSNPQTLDAGKYTQMLAAAYNKIKAADPNIIVVSGALAPTGCNNGVNCTDDFSYLQQMKAAGADKYMDCVGTHVNALRTPPDAGVGSQYDSLFSPPHHSWYFKDTVQGYQSIMGKQACITEFGVASEQSVGKVAGFEWAQDNTEQNQADWVTQGMGLARQWGARLVILWNLDYGPLSGVNDNALYSFYTPKYFQRPIYGAVKNWCAANGCK